MAILHGTYSFRGGKVPARGHVEVVRTDGTSETADLDQDGRYELDMGDGESSFHVTARLQGHAPIKQLVNVVKGRVDTSHDVGIFHRDTAELDRARSHAEPGDHIDVAALAEVGTKTPTKSPEVVDEAASDDAGDRAEPVTVLQ